MTPKYIARNKRNLNVIIKSDQLLIILQFLDCKIGLLIKKYKEIRQCLNCLNSGDKLYFIGRSQYIKLIIENPSFMRRKTYLTRRGLSRLLHIFNKEPSPRPNS